ncbi:hypothetical protein [Methanobrevibacter filiformis]|uniref:Uncharacterized protein n=1 Tax=Methanobrevibacter filiformis TaxID=55758 RepID=A0A165ZPJ5_9EURY|nr:hypothetical protein [Methanobrevibacter filiformis]KZX10992.1 hypothetical protein MBFIL_15640 [Methanobrevibacter filiformis]
MERIGAYSGFLNASLAGSFGAIVGSIRITLFGTFFGPVGIGCWRIYWYFNSYCSFQIFCYCNGDDWCNWRLFV